MTAETGDATDTHFHYWVNGKHCACGVPCPGMTQRYEPAAQPSESEQPGPRKGFEGSGYASDEDFLANEAVCLIYLFKPECRECCTAATGGDLCEECQGIHDGIVQVLRAGMEWARATNSPAAARHVLDSK